MWPSTSAWRHTRTSQNGDAHALLLRSVATGVSYKASVSGTPTTLGRPLIAYMCESRTDRACARRSTCSVALDEVRPEDDLPSNWAGVCASLEMSADHAM